MKGICGGDACVTGTRIPIWSLEQGRRMGFAEEKMLVNYPTLRRGDLAAVWDYVKTHGAEIGQAIRDNGEARSTVDNGGRFHGYCLPGELTNPIRSRSVAGMKTTIEIPDPLYRQAEIRAAAQRTSLDEILLRGLTRELAVEVPPQNDPESKVPFFARRKLLPAFRKLQESGALRPRPGDRDVTELISEDRDDRYS